VKDKYIKLEIFNLIILFILLLKTADYFQPYLTISVNLIIMTGLVLSVVLLKLRSNSVFFIAFLFWIFTGILKLIHFDVWAERTGIYSFESFGIGMIFLVYQNFTKKINKSKLFDKFYKKTLELLKTNNKY